MPKMKTNSGAKKRFRFSKNGKVLRGHSGMNHFLGRKSAKRKRNLRKSSVADSTNVKQIKVLMPYK